MHTWVYSKTQQSETALKRGKVPHASLSPSLLLQQQGLEVSDGFSAGGETSPVEKGLP